MAKLTNRTIEKLVKENKVSFGADPVPKEKYQEIRYKLKVANKRNYGALCKQKENSVPYF